MRFIKKWGKKGFMFFVLLNVMATILLLYGIEQGMEKIAKNPKVFTIRKPPFGADIPIKLGAKIIGAGLRRLRWLLGAYPRRYYPNRWQKLVNL